MNLSEAIKQHGQHLRAKRRSPKTLTWYDEQFAAFLRWRSEHPDAPDDALPDAEEIDAFLADQHSAGMSPATVHARYRALRALLRFLERRRKLTHDGNPIHLVEAPTVPKEVRRYVTVSDLDLLLNNIDGQSWLDYRDRVVLLILFYSGLRLSELCGLLVSDIDVAHLEVTVRQGKGDKARTVPCSPDLRTALAAYLYTRPNHTDVLLLKSNGFGGHAGALRPEGVRQMLIRRCAAVGIDPPYSPHAFRHGFAMWLLNAGVRATTVATAMGHSDSQVTLQIYAHTTATTVRREYEEALSKARRG
jgi:site-specific recombinase XerD